MTIKEVTFLGLKHIVDCIYTTGLQLNCEIIEDILPAAHLLQMTDIIGKYEACAAKIRLLIRILFVVITKKKALADVVPANPAFDMTPTLQYTYEEYSVQLYSQCQVLSDI